MKRTASTGIPPSQTDRRPIWLAAAGIAAAIVAAYHNSLSGPFVFDGGPAILDNASIRHLFPLWRTFVPPPDTTVTGRPLANFTLALNYAVSGRQVWSYHLLNLAVHVTGALILFGVVRRTLQGPRLRERFGRVALPAAFVAALLWGLHPLQAEAVTYVVQRVASLMGMFFLLTFYCFVRATEGSKVRFWSVAAVAACLLGVGCKEVIATAPVLVFLYDRTFVTGTFRAAWRARWRLHLALAATWVPLAALVASTGWNRNGTAGFDVGVKASAYWLTQFEAVTRYLALTVWPHPLVFEYGTFWMPGAAAVLPYVPPVVLLVGLTLVALRRWPVMGFLGSWVLALLSPTSVIPGRIQMIVEHRMYLPLAAFAALAAAAGGRWAGRRGLVALAVLALGLGVLTEQRNHTYRSALALWTDTVTKRPDNDRARNNLGNALVDAGEIPQAIAQYREALRLRPAYPEAHSNLGNALLLAGDVPGAIKQCEIALHLEPDYAKGHNNLGDALLTAGRVADAVRHFRTAVRLLPGDAKMHYNLGNGLLTEGRIDEAIEQFKIAERIGPPSARTAYNLGNAFFEKGDIEGAVRQYEEAVRIKPGYVEAYNNLGSAFLQLRRTAEAIGAFRNALRLRPGYAEAANNLGAAYFQAGRITEAMEQFETALRFKPNYPDARRNLARARARLSADGGH